ncbi:ABC transporter ATP-binding protein [Paenibacillus larvae]|uniref:ABC transporter ATP-binding protein n=1 Tax=Paenibacillus larvae TaxID=1464 RepID=UPI0023A9A0E2|nr:ABC transporter ATP-binding protein [Paenibacillus larvae]MDE5127630.1 ABC transporter ATP-binding protein [Paenibacillus larvae subsp. larvae]MDE5135220.1 ABC transporter ATP-binding protein [Paenibacillus larvae subsp. larvae]MDE5139241.1 ABC transporter ATP-binding protein [Paenibacillus larvae subsp. larvae]MDE5143512.1 ABC transporter ATP-binding protein [Paenibacillus larvae subsp. larvae]MDE5150289.1 ABC transporter ATP-binding protein [Paenibacillus larvae subsp. larvae]
MDGKSPIISIKNMNKSYGDYKVIKDLHLDIYEGEIIGLLGSNGAGKTTLISILSTLLLPDEGEGVICGYNLLKNRHEIKKVVSIVPQDLALYPTLTAYDNLSFYADLYGLKGSRKKSQIIKALQLAQLEDWANKRIDSFSGGMKRRINLVIGLLNEPKVVFLDEPTVGIDPQSRNHIFSCIRHLVDDLGITVIYTTHYMEEAETLCDRVAVYDKGEILDLDTPKNLIKKYGENDVEFVMEDTSLSFIEKVQSIEEVKSFTQMGQKIMIQCADSFAVTQKVMSLAQEEEVQIDSLNVKNSNLEHVFLHLTGKTLRA